VTAGGTTTLRRVRIRAGGRDRLLARLRAGRVLGAGVLRPPGLAPASVLCVRRFTDPRPGTLRLDAGTIRPPPEWEEAVAGALDRVLREAARPAREAVPASANAVLFADRGELLACLAADWLSGDFASRWWWPGIVGPEAARPATAPRLAAAGDGVRALVLDTWFAAPRYVAAAIELLAARGQAVAFVESLVAEEAAALAAVVATAAALPPLTAAAEAIAAPDRRLAAAPPRAEAAPPPWRAVAPETATVQLAPARELLLGVALALRRSPVAVRGPAFTEATRAWQGVAVEERPAWLPPADARPAAPAHAADEPRPPGRPRLTRRRRPRPRREEPPLAPPPTAAAEATGRAPERERRPAPPAERAARREEQAPRHEPAPATRAEAPDALRAVPGRVAEASAERAAVPAPPRPAQEQARATTARTPTAPEPAEPAEAIDTELGGLFFLVNLALHLDLLADFSAPDDPGIGLDPWDLVALLGARLLGDRSSADPVWPLLARLAGRGPREPPGRDFAPPGDWRMPRDWLQPWPETDDWTWSAARGRLRVRHPAGFAVLDVAGDASALDRELAPYAGVVRGLRRAHVPGDGARGRPATRWAHRLARYARPRLALALGADDPDLLLRRPARVLVTPSHVDVVLVLAQHPLEIRLAGLDRDPGWIPAAGRFLAFHFE
jgi:hypothetical protein